MMASATATARIDRPASEVFAFLADAENDALWRPGVVEIARHPAMGSERRTASASPAPAGGRSRRTSRSPPTSRIASSPSARSRGRCAQRALRVEALGDTTEVRSTLTAELRGLKRAMAPIVTKTMRSGRQPRPPQSRPRSGQRLTELHRERARAARSRGVLGPGPQRSAEAVSPRAPRGARDARRALNGVSLGPASGCAGNGDLGVVPEQVGSSGSPWRLRAAKRLSPKEDTGEAALTRPSA